MTDKDTDKDKTERNKTKANRQTDMRTPPHTHPVTPNTLGRYLND